MKATASPALALGATGLSDEYSAEAPLVPLVPLEPLLPVLGPPVLPTPVEAEPVEPAPVEAVPVEPGPVEVVPVEVEATVEPVDDDEVAPVLAPTEVDAPAVLEALLVPVEAALVEFAEDEPELEPDAEVLAVEAAPVLDAECEVLEPLDAPAAPELEEPEPGRLPEQAARSSDKVTGRSRDRMVVS